MCPRFSSSYLSIWGAVMDEILRRYHAAVKDITSRPYDYLNYRMSAFDTHMIEFEARLNDLKLYVGSYLERAYDPVWETAQAMRFLNKFQRIGRVIPVVAMEVKHQRILNQLLADLDRLSKVLFRFGEDPPIPKNFSPQTGNSSGSRHLVYSWRIYLGVLQAR